MNMPVKELDNEIALVTGASRGIGLAIALELGRQVRPSSVLPPQTTVPAKSAKRLRLRASRARVWC